MYAATLLADPTCLRLERVVSSATSLTLVVRTTGPAAACPGCGALSERVHSRYLRSVADLPWQGVSVRLELHARKFFCDDQGCPRRVFTERLLRVVAPHARRTRRLDDALTLLAFALGGEAGARAAAGLGLAAGADTLLARIRRAAVPEHPTPRVLGLDDWAIRAAAELAREFSRMIRGRCSEALAGWLDVAAGSGIAEFEGFAAGLRRDPEAVVGALSCEWSNGQTEGQINRLKMIKRQLYGRAHFDLLRARVLHRAQA